MSAPRIAITQRRDETGPPHDEIRDALDIRLAAFVLAAGGLPLPLPSALGADGLGAWLADLRPAGFLLSGGADIGRDAWRDGVETACLDHALRTRLPVLGLCRGMQMMAAAAGTASTDMPGHVATRHLLTGEIAREVNSFHGRALDTTPSGYRALAHAPDGTVEAMTHRDLPWEGWMWHPEREERFAAADVERFAGLLA